jgi:hypothetical protein
VPIRVAPGAGDSLADDADGFVLRVAGSEPRAAAAALRTLLADAVALSPDPDEVVVAGPVMAPGGPLVRIARLGANELDVAALPDRLVEHLEVAGVTDAQVEALTAGGSLDALDTCPRAAVLRIFPPPAGPAGVLPASWLDLAGEWVVGDLPPGERVGLRLLTVQFEVRAADAPATLHQAAQGRAWCDLVNGDLQDRVRSASLTFGQAPHVALAAGGPGCDDAALVARFELLAEIVRDLAPEVGYACLDVEPTFEGIGLGIPATGWRARGGAAPNLVAGRLCDIRVPDVFPLQILGPGHRDRMNVALPGDPPLGDPLAGSRMDVAIGDPGEWLPHGDLRAELVGEAEEILRPLLVTDAEAEELLAERPLDESPAAGVVALHSAGSHGVPDLAEITLERLPHPRRGLRLTLLELAAWLAGEPHTDAPASVSPVLATFARWFAGAIDDGSRQALKPLAHRLVGTAGAPEADVARVWVATDWLVRTQAPAWLSAAGLTDAADRLAGLAPIKDDLELIRAVDVLSVALTIAARRIDITTSIAAADDPDAEGLVEQASWDAWDEVSERSGWTAASEAAGSGIPPDLAYATDLRVIECARDSRARDELDAARISIGDAAWRAALHAVATEAWVKGWAAATDAIDEEARLPLRTALDRARKAVVERGDVDVDGRDAALDAADTAARDSLARAALRRGEHPPDRHPWDDALTAARTSTGGDIWFAVHRMAEDAVEVGPWDHGMQAARAAIDVLLKEGPDVIGRTVVGSLAREAASAAGRGVALRAAAVARAQRLDDDGVTDAAIAALASHADALQASAVDLLSRLIDPLR